ncbi:aldehyde dehydrogenase (NADP(+)) [Chitinasiproducens palmae]|uniref:NADP-dependent aldehyde dehydrogenase n=1 Tax=Chitinasiproducens palmae TaxID=1770053 RepID=A0A1H2PLE4_9BURK|nr:aldehyde dehydrogenase (NADP(+)) [Chitinasiproducens palmae]SDV47302.1 NADP-dependent aldehyde dehydrogenase [Chitinasiproducens palmae]
MNITGDMLIGYSTVRGKDAEQRAIDPAANAEIATPTFGFGGAIEVDRAARLAAAAFDPYRALPLETRATFLERIASEIEALGDALLERAHAESGLPIARLQGERGRTTGQLRLFASVVREGRFQGVVVDPALPDRQPLPRSDIRLRKIGLGPVAVFGASNFPLAFSVAGGDTAAALAAGCPVVVKAHNAHMGTSELVGRAIVAAARALALPEGVFSLLFGAGRELGEALVVHPDIKAVGFTGSRQGGLALTRIANARAEPIPVYAEMSSINPVFLFPAALEARAETIAKGFVASLTLGAGQFCTNPGLVFAVAGPGLDRFRQTVAEALGAVGAQTMLTPGIHASYDKGVSHLDQVAGVSRLSSGTAGSGGNAAQAHAYVTDAERFLASRDLQEEVFGPTSLIVTLRSVDEMVEVTRQLEGQLTATLQLDEADVEAAQRLLPELEKKVGRILANGFPTGVEVCHAMVHGGPFPSTSNAMYTSVGATSIERFLRPVAYQDLPDALRPDAIKASNPQGIFRIVDGVVQLPE